MELYQLRYFLETAKRGHLGRAANILAVSPSTVCHGISALEKELGKDLFAKSGKNIVLTDHGRLFMERVEKLLKDADQIQDEMSCEHAEWRGHYKIAAAHGLCSNLLAPSWARLQKGKSHLTAEIYSLRSAQVLSGTAAGEFDFGLCYSPQPHPNLNSKTLHAGQLVVAVSRHHPVTKKAPLESLRALSDYPAALPKAFQGIENCESPPVFRRFGIVARVQHAYDHYDVAVELAVNSLSWSLIPDWIVRANNRRLVEIRPKGWNAPVQICALWPKSHFLTKVLRELHALVGDQLRHTGG